MVDYCRTADRLPPHSYSEAVEGARGHYSWAEVEVEVEWRLQVLESEVEEVVECQMAALETVAKTGQA
jgi:hypothetical protein